MGKKDEEEEKIKTMVDLFITKVRRKQIKGRFNIGKHTAGLIREIVFITDKELKTQILIDRLRKVGYICSQALPTELVIGNTVRRVLFLIRDEYKRYLSKSKNKDSNDLEVIHRTDLANLLEFELREDFSEPNSVIRANIFEGIKDLISEMTYIFEVISEEGTKFVHSNEVILTHGHSHTVEYFLEGASKKKKFQVIVTEDASNYYSGHQMVNKLSKLGIKTTLISDASVFSVMSRVNKVICGTSAVLANGGLLAPCGTHLVSFAAKLHSVPFVVCNSFYKLTPLYPADQDTFNTKLNPSDILSFNEGNAFENVNVINPAYDYVPPNLVSLFISNQGTHNPSYIYRLLHEYYHPGDYDLEDEELTEDNLEELLIDKK